MTPPAALRVLSLNVRHAEADDGANAWAFRRERLLGYLREASPDLLGLQEALAGQLAEIEGALPHHRRLGVGRDDGRGAGEHAAILYDARRIEALDAGTFWLSPTPETPGSTGWGNAIPRICTWARLRDRATGAEFAHLNTHLDHLSGASRLAGIALLLSRVPPGAALLTGDFNVGESDPVVAAVRGAGLRDAFRALHPGAEGVGTFHGFGPEVGRERIDYVFVSAGMRVLAAGIGPRDFGGEAISDHLPVRATVAVGG